MIWYILVNNDYDVAYIDYEMLFYGGSMLISVIVPVYNAEKFLKETIESVLAQTYRELELILVDDGSTDNSGNICDEYARIDERIKVIHQVNKGISAARNVGLDIMNGEACFFLDSDDAMLPDLLQKTADLMMANDVDIVAFSYTNFLIPDDRELLKEKELKHSIPVCEEGVYTRQEVMDLQYREMLPTVVTNKLYKKKIWEKLRFKEGRVYEDTDIIFSVLGKINRMFITNDILLVRRLREGSVTKVFTYKNLRDKVMAYRHYYQFIIRHKKDYFSPELADQAVKKWYETLMSELYFYAVKEMDDKKKAIALLNKEIHNVEKLIELKKAGVRIRAAAFIHSYVPLPVAVAIYRFYNKVRK